jgi:subtilisin family serine protease
MTREGKGGNEKVKKSWVLIVLTVALVVLLCGQSFAAPEKVPGQARRMIVVFKNWVNEPAYDQVLQRTGAVKVKNLRLINAAVVLAGPASERALRQQIEVVRVEEDAVVHALAKPQPAPPPAESLPWGVDRIDADMVWDRNHDMVVDAGANAGSGIRVAVLDTGIDLDHPDLQANIKGGVNTINPRKSPDDDNGHGTHVAGIIAAVDNAIGVLGVAPQAWLYAVKVLDRQGSGFVSDIIEGLQWCIDNGMQVVNMSFGTSSDVQSFHDAIVAANNAGMVLVAAAGNSGPGDNTVLYPAKYQEVIAVSATDKSDAVPYWSSRGPEVELAAPGVDIYSTYKGGGYATLSGTSMAAPHVTGAAALVIAGGITDLNGNGLINDEVRSRLQSTAEDLGLAGRDDLYGYGLVDAERAVGGP